jgi:ribosomal protein L20A (L18A)
MKHKLLKRPQIKIERVTSSNEDDINDYDPNRFTNKDYFLKISKLYH